ncbi:hypothetical protein ACTFIV_010340 [Dictyostelium citrinum]
MDVQIIKQINKFNLENVGLSTDFNYIDGRFVINEHLSEYIRLILVNKCDTYKGIIDLDQNSNIIDNYYTVLWRKCCDSLFFQQLLQKGLWPETNLIKQALYYDNPHALEAAVVKFVGGWKNPKKTQFYMDIIQYSLSVTEGNKISRFLKSVFDQSLILAAIGYHLKREFDTHQIGKHLFISITKSKVLSKLSYKFYNYHYCLCEAITRYNEISKEISNSISIADTTDSNNGGTTASNSLNNSNTFKRNLFRLKRWENLILEIEIIMPLIKETILFEHSKLMSIYTNYEKSYKLEALIKNKFNLTLRESAKRIMKHIEEKKFQKFNVNVDLPNFNTLCLLEPILFNYFVELSYFNLESFGKWKRFEIPSIFNIDGIRSPQLKKGYIDGSTFLNLEMFKLTKSFQSNDPCSANTLQDDFLIHDRPDEEFLYFEENDLARLLVEDTFLIETDEKLLDSFFTLTLKDVASLTDQYVENDNHNYFQNIRSRTQQLFK